MKPFYREWLSDRLKVGLGRAPLDVFGETPPVVFLRFRVGRRPAYLVTAHETWRLCCPRRERVGWLGRTT